MSAGPGMQGGLAVDAPRDPERALRQITVGADLLERRLSRPSTDPRAADDDLLMVSLALSLERLAGEAGSAVATPEQRARLGDAAMRIRTVIEELAGREQRRLAAVGAGEALARSAGASVPQGGQLRGFSTDAVRTAVGCVLLALGLGLALFLAFEFGVTGALQARSQRVLLAGFQQRLKVGPFNAPTAPVAPGPVAILEIPSIGLHQVVVEGSGTQSLKQGPGHVAGTPLPGEFGNAVVIGHSQIYGGPFANLDRLSPGDTITTLTGQGLFTYHVTAVLRVHPGQRDVIGPATASRLTLVTSTSPFSGDRLAVVAGLAGRPVGVPRRPPVDVGQDELGTTGDATGAFIALLLAQALVAVLFVTVRLYRRWPPAAVYAVTTPVIAMILWLGFENLDRFLPGSM